MVKATACVAPNLMARPKSLAGGAEMASVPWARSFHHIGYIYRTMRSSLHLGAHHFLKQAVAAILKMANFFNSLVNICQTKHNFGQFTNKVGNQSDVLDLAKSQCFKDSRRFPIAFVPEAGSYRNHCYCLCVQQHCKIYQFEPTRAPHQPVLLEGTLTDSRQLEIASAPAAIFALELAIKGIVSTVAVTSPKGIEAYLLWPAGLLPQWQILNILNWRTVLLTTFCQ